LTLDENTELRELIRRIALLNAISYEGKAEVQPVLGKVLAERPHQKENVKQTASVVAEVVEEVNKLSLEQQRKIVQARWPEALVEEKVEEERGLPPLPNVDKYEAGGDSFCA